MNIERRVSIRTRCILKYFIQCEAYTLTKDEKTFLEPELILSIRVELDKLNQKYTGIADITTTTNFEVNGFVLLLDELFDDDINWGRILVALSEYVNLQSQLGRDERLSLVLLDRTKIYFEKKINPWLEENGGWDGFVESFNDTRKTSSSLTTKVLVFCGIIMTLSALNIVIQTVC